MSENNQNRHCVSIPEDWGLPKFHILQRVYWHLTSGKSSDWGTVMGFEYNDGRFEGDLGWYCVIAIDFHSPCVINQPCQWCESMSIPESDLFVLEPPLE